ncbi:leucine-rich repeat-containing protein 72 [Pseudophryne corroboree]|uniref:leucine-rich repeat-containing protein 72 n=1 Tax=Pseudophryne corroboree TaxID=495146 RepID=UPI0030817773
MMRQPARSRRLLATNEAKMAAEMIEEQMQQRAYKTDSDVSELYLGRKGLREVADLSRFRMLKYLWLNHNKISRINVLGNNFRLSELYLNNNELCDITGSLKHLTSLHTLMLNGNHLTKLQATVKELKGMSNLRILNLFHNPLEQDVGYRPYVIHHLPSVQILDREHVKHKEREDAFKLFNLERTAVMQSLGFGRRTHSVLSSRHSAQSSAARHSSQLSRDRAMTCKASSKDLHNLEDKVLLRSYQRSIMQFTLLDWRTVPPLKHQRSKDQPKELPQLITVVFR